MQPKLKPTQPFLEVAGDICSYAAKDYLILVNCYKDRPDIIPMVHDIAASHLTQVLRQAFCCTSILDQFLPSWWFVQLIQISKHMFVLISLGRVWDSSFNRKWPTTSGHSSKLARSRFVTGTESCYAIIELELHTITRVMMKCKIFLAGLPHFTVITGNQPLVQILNNHRLDEVESQWLQHLKARIKAHNFREKWLIGIKNYAPDALSCNPVHYPQKDDMLAEYDHNSIDKHSTIAELRFMANNGYESIHLKYLCKLAENNWVHQKFETSSPMTTLTVADNF